MAAACWANEQFHEHFRSKTPRYRSKGNSSGMQDDALVHHECLID